MIHSSIKYIYITPVILLLSACVLKGNKHEIHVHIQAAHYLNPDVSGNASPVKVTLYELKNNTVFHRVNFFTLQDNASHALLSTLIDQRSLMIRPNEQVHFKYPVSQEARYIGIVVDYRELSFAEWKQQVQLNDHLITHMHITLYSSSFTINTL